MDVKRILFSFCKTVGFLFISLLPVVMYVFKYCLGHQGAMPEQYQDYAVRFMSICFPVIATKLCFDNDRTVFKFFELVLLFVSLCYLFAYEQEMGVIGFPLDTVLYYLTLVVYLGTFVVSFMAYYCNPVSDKEISQMRKKRDEETDETEGKVNWKRS